MSDRVIRLVIPLRAPTGAEIKELTAPRVADYRARSHDRDYRRAHGLEPEARRIGPSWPIEAPRGDGAPPSGSFEPRAAGRRRMLWAALLFFALSVAVAAVWLGLAMAVLP